jgi:hypothetical protein
MPSEATHEEGALRIGILIDSFVQPLWVLKILEEIQAAGWADLVLVIQNGAQSRASGRKPFVARMRDWWRHRDSLPFALYCRWDRSRYTREDDPETPMDAASVVASVPVQVVTPRMTRHSDFFSDNDVAALRGYDLDVALRFGFRILRGDALRIARYGVWSYHHGDNRTYRGGPAGFWEVAQDEPTTGAILQVLSEDLDDGLVLGRTRSSTNRVSMTANRHNAYWQAVPLLGAKLRELRWNRSSLIDDARRLNGWAGYGNRLFLHPGGRETIGIWMRLLGRLVRGRISQIGAREQWHLAFRMRADGRGATGVPDGSPYRFRELIPPADRIWADPFAVLDGGRHFVFFEEHIVGEARGHICAAEIGPTGFFVPPRVVLEADCHLSYPFVFRWQDHWYMIPETAQQRAVQLYRASAFPYEWQFERTLIAGTPAVDATLAEIDGRWWMFAALAAPGAEEATMLMLYHASGPLGPWTPHRANPVKIDVRGSRGAGPLFQHEGRWYRPAQDGAPRYGSGIVIHRITDLSPAAFREEAASRLKPGWKAGITGTHTISAAGDLTVIDVRRTLRRFRHY